MNLKKVQQKAREIGHCLCSNKFTCPCNYYKERDVCKCAGGDVNMDEWVKINMN